MRMIIANVGCRPRTISNVVCRMNLCKRMIGSISASAKAKAKRKTNFLSQTRCLTKSTCKLIKKTPNDSNVASVSYIDEDDDDDEIDENEKLVLRRRKEIRFCMRRASDFKNACKPPLHEQQVSNWQSILSVSLNATGSMVWCLIDRNFHVHEWRHAGIDVNAVLKKSTFPSHPPYMHSQSQQQQNEKHEQCLSQLPNSDIVVFPHYQFTTLSKMPKKLIHLEKDFHAYAFQTRPNVFQFRENIVGRLFGLIVGNERVSSIPLLMQMLRGYSWPQVPSVTFANEEINSFCKLSDEMKEVYASALLRALAFYRVCLYPIGPAHDTAIADFIEHLRKEKANFGGNDIFPGSWDQFAKTLWK